MKYLKRIVFFGFIITIIAIQSLSAQSSPAGVDSTFEKYMEKAWSELREAKMPDSLQRLYSKKFYEYYQNNPTSKTGQDALYQAFLMWGNTGNAKHLDQALETIDYDSPLWAKIINHIGNIYAKNDSLDFEEFEDLLVDLKEKVNDAESKSAIILRLLYQYKAEEKGEDAIELARELVELDASEFYVDQGLGYLHELESLNIGQKAPEFEAQTISGENLSLSELKGQYVLLDFWATWCGPCLPEIPHLKLLSNKHADTNFQIVGISLDKSKKDLVEYVNENEIDWPQILDTEGWNGEIPTLYNVVGIPRTYLIDPAGIIIAKDLRGEQMVEEIESHMKE